MPEVKSSKMTKILIVSHYFPPHVGGIQNVAYNEAKLLSEHGYKVTVVTSALPRVDNPISNNESFKTIRIPAWNILEKRLGIPYPIFSPSLYITLKKEVAYADVIHVHGHVFIPSFISARIAKRNNKPLVLTQHNTFIEYKSKVLLYTQHMADRLLGKPTLRKATKVIAISEATKQYIESILPIKPIVRHNNGVDIERFKPTKDQKALRAELSLPADKIICFTMRRITFKNGIDTLIETAKLLKFHPDILFVIGGKGSDLKLVQKMIIKEKLKNVKLLGAVSDEELPRYYAASDIFILPSKKGEGFPLVILEALASGLAIIATRSGGHVEIVENSKFGFIVDPNSPEQVANKIEYMSNKTSILKIMQKNARDYAIDNLSWGKNISELIGVFEEVNI